MVRYLIQRPVAVIISFIAIVITGLIIARLLPISLLPDIKIPEITVYVSHPNTSALDLEKSIVAPMRNRLMQLPGLDDIQSESRDNSAVIKLTFDYGTNIDYAFIEANDKIDAAMSELPREVRRPRIIKASATDIPVFLLNLSYKNQQTSSGSKSFGELSEFAETVIRRRLEQLPSVAFADISGTVKSELFIIPDESKMQSQGIEIKDITDALAANNISVSGIHVREGQLQYNLIFRNELRTVEDVKNVIINSSGRPMYLWQLAQTGIRQQMKQGLYLSQGREAICLALIKSSDARIDMMRDEVSKLIGQMQEAYPEIAFETSQDQSFLLSYTINNLRDNLIQGCFLAILVMFLFIRDYRSPLLIAVSLPVTLVISLLFLYFFNISINIVSLSGLILGVGMMIDNSIVVIDNIIQHQQRGANLIQAISEGTHEVIAPMIAATLTSCAVFVPLIFLSGIAGALFYDQAIAIVIGQSVSLLVSITLTPTIFHLAHRKAHKNEEIPFLSKLKLFDLEQSYVTGFNFIFRHQKATTFFLLLIIMGGGAAFYFMEKRQLPEIPQNETVLNIDWNENIHVDENSKRSLELLKTGEGMIQQSNAFIGEQQFVLNRELDMSASEAVLYFKTQSPALLDSLKQVITLHIKKHNPNAFFEFSPPENPFAKIFSGKESNLTLRLRAQSSDAPPELEKLEAIHSELSHEVKDLQAGIPQRSQYIFEVLPEMLFLYEIDYNTLANVLKASFNNYFVDNLKADDRFIPIVIGSEPMTVNKAMGSLYVKNKNGIQIPVNKLIRTNITNDYRTIYGGREGVFVPVNLEGNARLTAFAIEKSKEIIKKYPGMELGFSGSYFKNRKLIAEMIGILIISVLLLYFILAAQFESLSTPLIVLTEIPIDLAFAMLFLWIAGNSINAMSLIGFVVMGGIIINDSILKIDTINQLRKEGYSLIDAIHEGGRRRLKPIVMTALVTVIALLPQMLGSDMGAKLQLPLSISMLGGMTAGTLVSLWIIPLLYYHTSRLGNFLRAKFTKPDHNR